MLERTASKSLAQELALVDYVERLQKFTEGRIAVIINLSQLASYHQRDHYIRIATDTFANNIKIFDGRLFVLANNDLVFIAKDASVAAIDGAVNRVRILFSEDPLITFKGHDSDAQFCQWYRLDSDYDEFASFTRQALKRAETERLSGNFTKSTSEKNSPEHLSPIRPEILAKLEQALDNADISSVVRRQTTCTLLEGEAPKALFEELYVSILDLQSIATPGINLLADRWLFQYLTQTLDRRMIMMLLRDGFRNDRPISLNLNIATVLSPEFTRWEQLIPPALRGKLVIEFNKLDVFSDMGTFLFARDYLRDHGFRLCLDGLTHHTLPYYDRSRLGFDLIKLYWTPDGIDNMQPEMMPSVKNIIMEAGQARAILCRVENERAFEIGQQLGIVMFQGRHVEKMLNNFRATGAVVPTFTNKE